MQLLQAGAALVWVVDPGQRLWFAAWSIAASALWATIARLTPRSAERTVSVPIGRDNVMAAMRQTALSFMPLFFGFLMRDLLPGRPTGWVRTGVLVASALAALALILLGQRWLRRRAKARTRR